MALDGPEWLSVCSTCGNEYPDEDCDNAECPDRRDDEV